MRWQTMLLLATVMWIILVPQTGYTIMDRFLIWTSWHKRYKWVNDNLINCYFNFLSWLSNQVVLQSKVLEVPWLTNHFHSVRLSWSNISLNNIQDKQKQDEVFYFCLFYDVSSESSESPETDLRETKTPRETWTI